MGRPLEFVDCVQSLFLSLVELVSERKFGRADVSERERAGKKRVTLFFRLLAPRTR